MKYTVEEMGNNELKFNERDFCLLVYLNEVTGGYQYLSLQSSSQDFFCANTGKFEIIRKIVHIVFYIV